MNTSFKASKVKITKRLKAATKNSTAIKGTTVLTRNSGGSYAKYTIANALDLF